MRVFGIILLVLGAVLLIANESIDLFSGFQKGVDAQAYQREQILDCMEPKQNQGLGE